MKLRKPADYIWIARWGRMMQSFPNYIANEQLKAAMANAPVDAICYSAEEGWQTIGSVTNPDTQAKLAALYSDCPWSAR